MWKKTKKHATCEAKFQRGMKTNTLEEYWQQKEIFIITSFAEELREKSNLARVKGHVEVARGVKGLLDGAVDGVSKGKR